MDEYKGIDYLRRQLQARRVRIDLRYAYYDMKHLAQDLMISTPPDLKWMMAVLGWCGTAVDSIADRLDFGRFRNDAFGLTNIYQMNNKDVLVDSLILDALISSCSFNYITQDADRFPAMRCVEARNATGIIDPITYMLKEGYAILDVDEYGQPITEVYCIPHRTDIYERGKFVRSWKHPAPYPLLVPIIYRPDAKRPFGHSRISRACMNLQDSACRTIKRSEIAAEFFSYPQRYVLGMDPYAEKMDKWKVTMSTLFRVDKDEDGDKPTVGQFPQQSMAPHTEQLKMFASAFAGETGLTVDDLGFPGINPSSYESIKASHETLRRTARKAQKKFAVGLMNAGYLAACIRDGQDYRRSQLYETEPVWNPIFEPDLSDLAGVGDAVQKIQLAFPDYFDESKLYELTGI